MMDSQTLCFKMAIIIMSIFQYYSFKLTIPFVIVVIVIISSKLIIKQYIELV